MARPRVLIVGFSTRALAESAVRAGWACVSVDAFGDLDQKARADNVAMTRDLGRAYSAAAVVAAGRRFAVDAAAYVGNLENHPAAVRRLAEGRELLGNSPAALAGARDVAKLARVVRRAGARVPETRGPSSSAPQSGEWLRKPARGGGGSGVRRFIARARLRAGEIVQERVQGLLASASFAADGQRAVLLGLAEGLAGDSAFGASGYRYCGSLFPLPASTELMAKLDAVAQVTTRAFGLRGINGIDFVLRDGEPLVLELNPRYSASMELIERSRGASVFEIHAAACRGALPPVPWAPKDSTETLGKAVLWARRDLVVGDTRTWLARDDVRDVPHPGERIPRGHPVCTVFARGRDAAACRLQLVEAAARVEHGIEAAGREVHA